MCGLWCQPLMHQWRENSCGGNRGRGKDVIKVPLLQVARLCTPLKDLQNLPLVGCKQMASVNVNSWALGSAVTNPKPPPPCSAIAPALVMPDHYAGDSAIFISLSDRQWLPRQPWWTPVRIPLARLLLQSCGKQEDHRNLACTPQQSPSVHKLRS